MWVRVWLAFSVSAVCSQLTNAETSPDGAAFGWNWRLSPASAAEGAVAQYYVKLPQSEQQARYSADSSYQGVSSSIQDMLQAHSIALGHKLYELNNQKTENVYETAQSNSTQIPAPPPSAQPVDIYLLQQQYTPYTQSGPAIQLPNTVQPSPRYYTAKYNTPTQGKDNTHNETTKTVEDSKPLQGEDFNEYHSPVQIFKDHNCTETTDISKDLQNDLNKSKALFAEVPSYDFHDINNFATSLPELYTYRGAVKFRVETPRPNARNERYYYTTVETPTYVENTTLDGIDKLVASTQDLISNEDLLYINHAAEKHIHEQSEDIKPRSRYVYKNNDPQSQDTREHITVKAKIGNIVNSNVQQVENDRANQQEIQSDSNNYNFATPIVVSENSYNSFREQIVDNLVSTMVPYMANGYQIVGVKDTLEENHTNHGSQDNEVVDVTPRPINQNYLAPITVALRLINANESEMFNTVDDHEAADSEFIEDSVKSPSKEKTIVEVQQSIPVEITHINDVEVHEYIDIDEGRSNNKGTLDEARSLYNKYVDALKNSKKIQDNMSKLLYQYGASKEESEEKEQDSDTDQLDTSENIQSSVQVNANDDSNNQRSEHIQYYENYDNGNQKIIQPIIIEKEVPITKFIDRFIEKKVPYPQQVRVNVPVDRPVPVAVQYEKIVEKPVEVTRYVDKPYPVEVPRPYPVEVKVPYPVEQKVYVDRPIHVPYPVEKVVEKQVLHPVPVPTPVGIPIEVPYPVEHKILYPIAVDRPVPVTVQIEKPVERIVHKEVPVPYAVEKKVPYPVHYETRVPVPYPVEKRIPVPVDRIIEKPVTVTKYVEKPIHIQVPVPQPIAVPVPQPYPVEKIVEKRVPYPVPVDRIVEKPVQVPYPVEKIVEKIVEKPVVVTKYIDKPYPVERKVPYPVEKIVEKKIPYAVRVPVEIKVPYPVEKIVDRPIHIPVPYAYSHSEIHAETKNNPQYQQYKDERQKKLNQSMYLSQYYQLLKEHEKFKQPSQRPVQSTQWGNQYASSYQYINNTSGSKPRDDRKLNSLENYLSYITNAQSKLNNYYGPVPVRQQNDWWKNNKNYIVEVKMRRADREPKFSNLRIEYGGFKPPLIPSTEVDLDGMPINKET